MDGCQKSHSHAWHHGTRMQNPPPESNTTKSQIQILGITPFHKETEVKRLPDPISCSCSTRYLKKVFGTQGFPGGAVVKNLPANSGDPGDRFAPWIRKIPWKRKQQPTPVFLPGEFHRQRSLVGYSSWGCTELDTTELVHMLSSFGPQVEDVVHYSRAVSGSSSERDASLGSDLYIMPLSKNTDVKLSHYNIWPLNVLFIRIIWESEWAKVDEINKCQSRNRLGANTLSQ